MSKVEYYKINIGESKETYETVSNNAIPENYRNMLISILGKENSYLPNNFNDISISDHKKQLTDSLRILKNIIHSRTFPNKMLYEELEAIVELNIKNINDANTLEQILSLALSGTLNIIFLLLGRYAQDRDTYKKMSVKNFSVDQYATLTYTQNDFQKSNLIKSYVNKCSDAEINREQKENINKYFQLNIKKPSEFIDWFKQNFTSIYIKIF